jgi:thioredoxin-dependent peroxiredoxin
MARHLLAGLLTMLGLHTAQADALKPGDPAPAFALTDQSGKPHALADYRGKWLILYFYPKDDTPGCTTEACNFRDDISRITALGANVVGVSLDDSKSHARFAEKFKLPFPLLADTGGEVARSYGSLTSLGPIKFAKRHSFIIRPDGRIAKIYRDVNPDTHSRDIQKDLKALQAGG